MGLLDDILAAAAAWPAWQSDTLRRVFTNGTLTPDGLIALRAMVEGSEDAETPEPLKRDHLPHAGSGSTTVLTGLRDLHHVNAFSAGRSLDLEPTGLTVIFGENGTGKSGFSRVLKRACRARHSKAVLPHAFGTRGVPRATIDFVVHGRGAKSHDWTEGSSAHADLAMVSVYDSQCGADYVSTEAPCDVQPFGLAQLAELARAQAALQTTIARDRDAIRADPSPFVDLQADPDLAPLLRNLGAQLDLDPLRQLAGLSPKETERLIEIAQLRATLDVETPAKEKEQLARRLAVAAPHCRRIEQITSDEAISRLFDLIAKIEAAADADRASQALVAGDSLDALPHTGSETWKALFRAADNFSREIYPHAHEHPNTEDGAQCVLCQQDLAPSARDRIAGFRSYIGSEAARNLAACRQSLDDALSLVAQRTLTPLDEPLALDLAAIRPALATQLEADTIAWTARKAWIEARDWMCPRPMHSSETPLSEALIALSADLELQAQELRASRENEKIAELEAEQARLAARQKLGELLAQLEAYVDACKRREALRRAHAALDTTSLSRKITALSRTYVNEALRDRMQQELRAIGYRQKLPVLKASTVRGINRIGLALDGTTTQVSELLSEGEQRAMGFAMFLAEAALRRDLSTLIFDDPSTSLDHRFRRSMARHLLELSKERPVVVFTHDAVFLTEIQLAVREEHASHAVFRTVQWDGQAPGAVIDGLAWENKEFKDQMAEIRANAEGLAATQNAYPNDAEKQSIRELHGRLRGAIERGVRDVVLFGTVHPFMDEIQVSKLGAVAGFQIEEWEQLMGHHDACSGIFAGHDTSPDRQQEVPTATDLVQRLRDLDTLFGEFDKRRKTFDKDHRQPLMEARSAPRKR